MRSAIRTAAGQAEEESIVNLSATTTTPPGDIRAAIRGVEDLSDKA